MTPAASAKRPCPQCRGLKYVGIPGDRCQYCNGSGVDRYTVADRYDEPAAVSAEPTLLPCPFCGSEAAMGTMTYSSSMVREQGWGQDKFYKVNCVRCGSNNLGLVGHHTERDAAEHWNRRAPASAEPVNERELHRVWTYAVGRDGYDKKAFNHVQRWFQILAKDAAPTATPVGDVNEMVPGDDIDSPFNACCYRGLCRGMKTNFKLLQDECDEAWRNHEQAETAYTAWRRRAEVAESTLADATTRAERAEAALRAATDCLTDLDRRGGLGLDVHERIRLALGGQS